MVKVSSPAKQFKPALFVLLLCSVTSLVLADNVTQDVKNSSGATSLKPLRDPTTPLNHRIINPSQKSLVLQAIFRSAGSVQAIVNGKSVTVGSVVDGATIIAINDKSITYRRGGESRVLKLRPSIVKKTR